MSLHSSVRRRGTSPSFALLRSRNSRLQPPRTSSASSLCRTALRLGWFTLLQTLRSRANPMAENSFDVVSKVDLQEVANAIQNALKEIHTRFDLKDSKSDIQLEGKEALILTSADDYKLKAVTDILQSKLVKRG